jgi:hypothetical protein
MRRKWESIMQTTTTRRDFMAGVPAVAATIGGTGAATALGEALPSVAGHSGDEELLALWRQIEPIAARCRELSKMQDRVTAEIEALHGKLHDIGCQIEACDSTELIERIMALPAHTLAGLAVKARVAAIECSNYWTAGDGAGWSDKNARAVIEAVLRLAGEPLPG